jgi:hypothetical protein
MRDAMRRREVQDDPEFDAHVEAFAVATIVATMEGADGFDGRMLMMIATKLPRYDAVGETEAIVETIGIYAELRDALRGYIAVYQWHAEARERDGQPRPTVGTMRASLKRLDKALAEVAEAWAAADLRTQNALYLAIGDRPFDADSEMRPHSEAGAPSDAWERGGYRILKWEEGTARLAEGVATVKREADAMAQERRGPDYPGLDELTRRLAKIFTRHTGRPFNASHNRDSATDFFTAVVATLPEQCRPAPYSIAVAIGDYVRER